MSEQTMQFGVYYMLDGHGADPHLLKDKAALTHLLLTLPKRMGIHSICDPVVVEVGPKNRKDPGEASGFVMIVESHFSFHTFPNRSFITIDIYTCQNDIDSDKLSAEFRKAFRLENFDETVIKRGTKYPVENLY